MKRAELALWFIEHNPENEFAGGPSCQVFVTDPTFGRVSKAWERVLESPDASPKLIANAASFFTLSDPGRARSLLERGERLTPASPDWAYHLGENLFRDVAVARSMEDQGREINLTREALKATALQALAHFERALAAAPSVGRRFQILPSCAKAALEGERWEDAIRYADETIAVAPRCSGERHRPDFIHWAHMVRGKALLESGDADGACLELDAAGKQGSIMAPVLRSFGPEFRLARALLERGRKEAVLSYLDRCATFWHPRRIARWRSRIERGEHPPMFTGFDPDEPPEDRVQYWISGRPGG